MLSMIAFMWLAVIFVGVVLLCARSGAEDVAEVGEQQHAQRLRLVVEVVISRQMEELGSLSSFTG